MGRPERTLGVHKYTNNTETGSGRLDGCLFGTCSLPKITTEQRKTSHTHLKRRVQWRHPPSLRPPGVRSKSQLWPANGIGIHTTKTKARRWHNRLHWVFFLIGATTTLTPDMQTTVARREPSLKLRYRSFLTFPSFSLSRSLAHNKKKKKQTYKQHALLSLYIISPSLAQVFFCFCLLSGVCFVPTEPTLHDRLNSTRTRALLSVWKSMLCVFPTPKKKWKTRKKWKKNEATPFNAINGRVLLHTRASSLK